MGLIFVKYFFTFAVLLSEYGTNGVQLTLYDDINKIGN